MSDVSSISHEMWCALRGDHSTPLLGKFIYAKRDPWAVKIIFSAQGGTVDWVFGRELLIEGTLQPTGVGDVRIWPSGVVASPGSLVNLEFRNATGAATVSVNRAGLLGFLKRSLELVPVGHERKHLDIDAAIQVILAGEATA